jgi:hypothetical protein
MYAKVSNDILLSFQGCVRENGFDIKPVIKVKPQIEFDEGETRADGTSSCRLNWSAVHTPHASRSSFITRRAGSLEYIVLAELVGQSDVAVTGYYDRPDFEDVVDALKIHERPMVDASSSISELRGQLTSPDSDKDEVVSRFGISSLRETHETDTANNEPRGLEALRSSQLSELVFRDTHICPVGEMRPDDIILAAGAPMRCGTCSLACKSVDHLPAIDAKCRSLIARMQSTSAALIRGKAEGVDQGHLRRLHDDLSSDSYQLVGWQDASTTLCRLLEEKRAEGIVVGSPEIIKRHLRRVVRQVKPAQFLVDRIVDAKMYPQIADEVLRVQASRLSRKLAMKDIQILDNENEEIFALYSHIKTRLMVLGKTWDEAAAILEDDAAMLISQTKNDSRIVDGSA